MAFINRLFGALTPQLPPPLAPLPLSSRPVASKPDRFETLAPKAPVALKAPAIPTSAPPSTPLFTEKPGDALAPSLKQANAELDKLVANFGPALTLEKRQAAIAAIKARHQAESAGGELQHVGETSAFLRAAGLPGDLADEVGGLSESIFDCDNPFRKPDLLAQQLGVPQEQLFTTLATLDEGQRAAVYAKTRVAVSRSEDELTLRTKGPSARRWWW